MRLVYRVSHTVLRGQHVYSRSDYAFDFVPTSEGKEQLQQAVGYPAGATLSIRTLQIEADVETGRLLYVWGYCPWVAWEEDHVSPEGQIVDGEVFVTPTDRLYRGGGTDVPARGGEWRFIHDPLSGWVVARGEQNPPAGIHVRIADGCLLSLVGTSLNALWIHPRMRA